jgi:alpha-beta hydrolase superfamily lysophospholipase
LDADCANRSREESGRRPLDPSEREWWIDPPDAHRLHVRSWEEPGARAHLIILHGLGDHSGRFERVGKALARRGFAVWALDLPGHGLSEGPRGHVRSWAEYRDAVTALLARRGPVGETHPLLFLGHSMGALVALDWTFANPGRTRALVLSAPPFDLAMKPLIFKVWLARLAEKVVPALTQANQIPPSLLSRDPEVVRAHRADPLVHHRISARLYIEFVKTQQAYVRRAGELPVPALVIQGGRDPVASAPAAERWARSAPTGRVRFLLCPPCLHEVLNEPEGPQVLEEMGVWCAQMADAAPVRSTEQ